jgi:hypothetical protein
MANDYNEEFSVGVWIGLIDAVIATRGKKGP